MSIAIGIISAPREKQTLAPSLFSMHEAGFNQLMHIFREPRSADVPALSQARIHQNPHTMGNFRNWVMAAQWLLENTTDNWVMMCEDDITWARNACSVLEYDLARIKMDTAANAISLYCADRMAQYIRGTGQGSTNGLAFGWYHIASGKKMWGAQCLVFARPWLRDLLDCPYMKEVWATSKADTKNIDLHVSESITKRGKTILYRIPCLVDHKLGDQNSSLYGKTDRPKLRTSYFKDPAC